MFAIDGVLVDLIVKIFKSIVDGVTFKQKGNQDLYNNFVLPALNNFEIVHQNYLSSFEKYISLIKDANFVVEDMHYSVPLMNEILNDAIFTENLRNKLKALYPFRQDIILGNLIIRLMEYFEYHPSNTPLFHTEDYWNKIFKWIHEIDDPSSIEGLLDMLKNYNFVRGELMTIVLRRNPRSTERQTYFIPNENVKKEKDYLINSIKIEEHKLQIKHGIVIAEFERLRFELLRN